MVNSQIKQFYISKCVCVCVCVCIKMDLELGIAWALALRVLNADIWHTKL